MLNLLPLSPKGCLYRQWVPPDDLMFLKRRAWLPLHRREVVEASSTMPLAVARVGKQQWRLVALCGIFKQHNVWVQQGQWVGRYRPQCLDTSSAFTRWMFVQVLGAAERSRISDGTYQVASA